MIHYGNTQINKVIPDLNINLNKKIKDLQIQD